MPKEAPPNDGATLPVPLGAGRRVSEMQAKLHRWAAADAGRRFDDLFVRREAPRDRAGVRDRRRGLVAAGPRS
jgi:RNA-directed DNA polymerase